MTKNKEGSLSRLEMLAGAVGTVASTAAHHLYRGLENLTPDNTPKDFNYYATGQYARMAGGISVGLIVDSGLSKVEEKLHLPKKMKGLAAMAATVCGYAALKHYILDSSSSIDHSYLSSIVTTYADYWRAVASVITSSPSSSVPDLAGGAVMVSTTLKAIKNLIYSK